MTTATNKEKRDLNEDTGYVPEVNPLFVKTPEYEESLRILKMKDELFFPVLLTGPTGAGKTFSIEQACAALGVKMFRVNLTIESDEDALMGGFRLVDGNTEFQYGPVVRAMQEGALLLLDEVDLASPTKIMCLQSVMEGNGYYSKRNQTWIHPKKGFQVFATANTKGIGDNTGRYVGTQNLNEAFLERFPVTFEVDYPSQETETNILLTLFNSIGLAEDKNKKEIINALINFATQTREASKASDLPSISTRRLVHIVKSYKIFGSVQKAVEHCITRFDSSVKMGFMDIWVALMPPNKEEVESQRTQAFNDLRMKDFRPFGS